MITRSHSQECDSKQPSLNGDNHTEFECEDNNSNYYLEDNIDKLQPADHIQLDLYNTEITSTHGKNPTITK